MELELELELERGRRNQRNNPDIRNQIVRQVLEKEVEDFEVGVPWYKGGLTTFILHFGQWIWSVGLLVSNIYFSSRDDDLTDVYSTIGFHFFSCTLLTIFEFTNFVHLVGVPLLQRRPKFLIVKWVLSLLTLWKPMWYYSLYRHSKDRKQRLYRSLKKGREITREEIQDLVTSKREELEKSHAELVEVFVSKVPMALLQLYFSVQKNPAGQFNICSSEDLNRVLMVVTSIFSSAGGACSYSAAYSNYLKSIHLLDFFSSTRPNAPNSNSQGWTLLTGVLNFICHFILNVYHFYAIFYFGSINPNLALIFILALFVSNWLLLEILPWLRMTLDNPPLGVSTLFSKLIDRWINVFDSHMIRFTALDIRFLPNERKRRFCNLRVPLPIWSGALQLLPFIISVAVVSLSAPFILHLDTDFNANFNQSGTNLTILRIPRTVALSLVNNSTSDSDSSSIMDHFSSLFTPGSAHSDAKDKIMEEIEAQCKNWKFSVQISDTLGYFAQQVFKIGGSDQDQENRSDLNSNGNSTVNSTSSFGFGPDSISNSTLIRLQIQNQKILFYEVFGTANILNMSLVVYVILSLFYSMFLKCFELTDEKYPVSTALEFWRVLLDKEWTDKESAKRFMALTLIQNSTFFKILWLNRLTLCCFCLLPWRSRIFSNVWTGVYQKLLRGQRRADGNFEERLKRVKNLYAEHANRYYLESFRVTCRNLIQADGDLTNSNSNVVANSVNAQFVLLMEKFYHEFDDRMMELSSYRIEKTFGILGVKLEKNEDE